MAKIFLTAEKQFCGECSLALRRFIGGMEGVTAVDVENGSIAIDFDEQKFPEEDLRKLARDSVERLGYRVEE